MAHQGSAPTRPSKRGATGPVGGKAPKEPKTTASGSGFLAFGSALSVAQPIGLASRAEWVTWCKMPGQRPTALPSDPAKVYEDAGWQGWRHWLGTGQARHATPPAPFAEALAIARALGLASRREWRA